MTNDERIRANIPDAKPNAAHAVFWQLFDVGIKTQSAMAETIGESPTQWNRHLRGHKSPTCRKVQGWLETASANGVELKLVWTREGVR